MKQALVTSLTMLLLLTVVTGLLYPLSLTLLANLIFPVRSNGSFIERDGGAVGSEVLSQSFNTDRYFWPRPSAIDHNPLPSGASNLGPTSDRLRELVQNRRAEFLIRNGLPSNTFVPGEMLFASASGIDPHISPASARLQVARVAHARNFDSTKTLRLQVLVEHAVEQPTLGFLGETRINVLKLNLALDELDRQR
jgi:K+-transporting ATPase ATPase C chain